MSRTKSVISCLSFLESIFSNRAKNLSGCQNRTSSLIRRRLFACSSPNIITATISCLVRRLLQESGHLFIVFSSRLYVSLGGDPSLYGKEFVPFIVVNGIQRPIVSEGQTCCRFVITTLFLHDQEGNDLLGKNILDITTERNDFCYKKTRN